MLKWRAFYLVPLSLLLAGVVACNNDETASPDDGTNEEPPESGELATEQEEFEPVTLTVGQAWNEDEIEYLQELLDESYPHITLELVEHFDVSDTDSVEEAILTNSVPDLFNILPAIHSHHLYNFELDNDLSDMIEQFDFDLSRLDQGTVESIRNFSRNGGILGLPKVRAWGLPQAGVMTYNKDIFDLFGAPYPTDGMTWDEVIDLAAQVTGERDGIHYYGLQFHLEFLVEYMSNGHRILDPETHQSVVSESEIWRRGFDTLEQIYSLPGQVDPENDRHMWEINPYSSFVHVNHIAMQPWWAAHVAVPWTVERGGDWDIVAAPQFEDAEPAPIGSQWTYTISSTSEHKEDAFRVLETAFTDEFQIFLGSNVYDSARLPVEDPNVHEQVEMHPVMEDKNMDARWYHEYGPPEDRSPYEAAVRSDMQNWMSEFVHGDDDVVTFLRKMDEEINTMVEELRANE